MVGITKSSVLDLFQVSSPGNPPVGQARMFYDGTNFKVINSSGTSIIGGGTPGGINLQIQFNDNGAFGGNAAMVFDKNAQTIGFVPSGVGASLEINVGDGGANSTDAQFTPTFIFLSAASASLRDSVGPNKVVEVGNTSKLGFFGTAPIVKPTITGAKGGNAALTSLLSQLAALGLVIDSTT